MISEHSAHSTPQPFGIRTWLWRYTCLLLISMLWHRQALFELKGDKLSSSAECRIRTHQGLRHQIASRLNARWQTDWAIEDQAKNFNSTARPYDQRAFSPLHPTAVWHSHLALAIYMFVVVNFDALAQASDIRIERRQVVFLCWMLQNLQYNQCLMAHLGQNELGLSYLECVHLHHFITSDIALRHSPNMTNVMWKCLCEFIISLGRYDQIKMLRARAIPITQNSVTIQSVFAKYYLWQTQKLSKFKYPFILL